MSKSFLDKFSVVCIKIRNGEAKKIIPLVQQVAQNVPMPEDAKAMAGFWVQGGYLFISFLKAQYVLDTALMWRLLILKLPFGFRLHQIRSRILENLSQ